MEKIVPDLVNDGVPVLGFAVQQPSLEDVFVVPDRGGLRCQRLRCWPRPGGAGADPVRALPGRFLRSELGIIFGRRRNLAGLAVLAVVPIILAIADPGVLAGRRRAAGRASSSGSPATGCSWPSPR